MSKLHSVKLYIYEDRGDVTYIDSIEAESFDEFVLVKVEDGLAREEYEQMHEQFVNIFPNKKMIIMPASMNISFHGVRVEDDDRPFDSELQHETPTTEIA